MGKYPIIRSDEDLIGFLPLSCQRNGAARTSDSRIDNDHVDGTGREISASLINDDGRLNDVIRRDVMGNIDDLNVWSETENDTFHRPDKGILQAEIRG